MYNQSINRRDMLKFLGGTLALPLLESNTLARDKSAKPPKRLVFLSFTYGMMPDFYPTTSGLNYKLTDGMKALAKHKKDFTMLGNLSNKRAFHPHRSCTTFLTGADTRSTPGVEFKNSMSCDQLLASKIGAQTRFSSLPLNSKKACSGWGPGLSMSWGEGGRPIQGINGPTQLYHKLFGGGAVTLDQRKMMLKEKKSLLDTVLVDAKSLNKKITKTDRVKVDSYFQSIRDLELGLHKANQWIDKPLPKTKLEEPDSQLYGEPEVMAMFDLINAAFQTDSSRIVTYRINCGELMKSMGLKLTGVHPVSHYRGNKVATVSAIARDKKLCELLSVFYDKMKATKDVDGSSLFDNSLIVFGNGIRTGHTTNDIPLIFGGYGGGGIKHNGHKLYESKTTPLSNLWVSLLNQMGMPVDKFSDSDGRLEEVFA
ncbi:MAG: DUF1552 domain-containing protein [Lentisphaeraceae bacterium]|nr:DUF1552 domain-containing protein [Lentisphaeraceae bacterium]